MIFKDDSKQLLEGWNPLHNDIKEPRLFVFAAGGTGMRVVEALTILTASGYLDECQHTIIPILFDFDLNDANLCQVETCLKLYRKLHQNSTPSSFFSHKISPLYMDDNTFLFDMEHNDVSLFEKYQLDAVFIDKTESKCAFSFVWRFMT